MADKKNNRPTIKINRDKEERSKDISRFISEGGLGARSEYYDIEKVSSKDEAKNDNKNEKDKNEDEDEDDK